MNNEIKITLIACAIIFAGIGALALNTINSDQMTTPQPQKINTPVKSTENIIDNSLNNLSDFPKTFTKKIDDNISIRLTTVILSIPQNNTLPWGTVTGMVDNPVPGNPVIIQFFKLLDEKPIHIAQVNLNEDNSFEYKFRLLSVDDGKTTHIFEGDYFVKIFKTVVTP